jgi:hypothetical protein
MRQKQKVEGVKQDPDHEIHKGATLRSAYLEEAGLHLTSRSVSLNSLDKGVIGGCRPPTASLFS